MTEMFVFLLHIIQLPSVSTEWDFVARRKDQKRQLIKTAMIGSQMKQQFKRVQKTHENPFVLFLSHPYTGNVFVHIQNNYLCAHA